MFVAFVDAVGIGVGAAIIGVPLALPLGVLVFLGSFIPIVGALVTGAVAVLLALVANGSVNALIMLGIVLLVQQLESHILQPLVMGKAVSLHPVAVILAVAAGLTSPESRGPVLRADPGRCKLGDSLHCRQNVGT